LVSEGEDEEALVTRLGFITFEHPDGTCYWYDEGGNAEDQIRDYWDFLGSDWTVARIMGGVGAAGGILFFMFSLSMCCSSHFLAVRRFMSFLLWVVLTLFQCLTFLVFSSDICTENECQISRSAGWSIGSAVCFALSGLCHILMRDYPGRPPVESTPAATAKPLPAVQEQAPVDEEAVPAQEDEEGVEEETMENEEPFVEETAENNDGDEEVDDDDDEEIVAEDEAPEDEVIADEEDPESPPTDDVEEVVESTETAVEEAADPESPPTSEEPQTVVEEAQVEEPAMEKTVPEEGNTAQEEVVAPVDMETTNEPSGPSEAEIPGGGEWTDSPK
jgi:hypothetical protein